MNSKDEKRTIFFPITSAGGTVYKIRAFQEMGWRVVGGDANPFAIGKFICDAFYQLPWRSEPNYYDEIIKVIKQEKVDVYVTSGEMESLEVARNRKKFLELGCIPTAANLKTLEMGVDKCNFFEFLQSEVDIPLPLFHSVETLDDFDEGLEELSGAKVCMKPAVTSGSKGFVVVSDDPPPPDEIFKKRISYPMVSTAYIRDALRNSALPKMIMMEYLEDGENLNASLVGRDGELIFSSVHTRENVKDGLSTRGRIVKNNEIVEYNRRIAKALELTGFIVAQYIGNKIIEINPRWSTSIIYKTVNEPLMGIKVWTGEEIIINPDDVKVHQTLSYERYYETKIYDIYGNGY